MTRKYSEAEVRKALDAIEIGDEPLLAYKPPDMPGPWQNTKPADFMVWFSYDVSFVVQAGAAMIEVKETDAAGRFNLTESFRPAQLAAMRQAQRIGLRYLVVVRWSKLRRWTITTGPRVLSRLVSDGGDGGYFRSDMPIDCPPGDLAPHLRAALLGEID